MGRKIISSWQHKLSFVLLSEPCFVVLFGVGCLLYYPLFLRVLVFVVSFSFKKLINSH